MDKKVLIKCEEGFIHLGHEPTIYCASLKSGAFISAWDSSAQQCAVVITNSLKQVDILAKKLLESLASRPQVEMERIYFKAVYFSDQDLSLPELGLNLARQTWVRKPIENAIVRELLFLHPESKMKISVLSRRKRILIIDDSKTVCSLLSKIFSSDAELEVVGTISDPDLVERSIRELKPDVITLDIHMPKKDGITLLKELLPQYPIPVVMVSALSLEDGNHVLEALESGAVDSIQKPSFDELETFTPVILEKVKTASTIKVKVKAHPHSNIQPARPSSHRYKKDWILAIGASTGGTEAIRDVMTRFPAEIPPTLIVQHIPAIFSKAFAQRLNELCPFEVKEAEDGDLVLPNRVLIAPGGLQMTLSKEHQKLIVRVQSGLPVNRHIPSVDVLFESVAKEMKTHAVGVILTGMGADGAKGLLKMKSAGARTIAQDESSSVVFGMPKKAIELGAAENVASLQNIPNLVLSLVRQT